MFQAVINRHVDNIYQSATQNASVPTIDAPDFESLGGRVAYGRALRGFSQSELARRAGCAQPTIWALENNDTKEVTAKLLDSVARALELSWEFLLRGPGPDVNASISEAEILAVYRELTPQAKFSLLEFGRHLKATSTTQTASDVRQETDEEIYKRLTTKPVKKPKGSRKHGT
jgi:transcriptional regulator with XRE-family HTH domain